MWKREDERRTRSSVAGVFALYYVEFRYIYVVIKRVAEKSSEPVENHARSSNDCPRQHVIKTPGDAWARVSHCKVVVHAPFGLMFAGHLFGCWHLLRPLRMLFLSRQVLPRARPLAFSASLLEIAAGFTIEQSNHRSVTGRPLFLPKETIGLSLVPLHGGLQTHIHPSKPIDVQKSDIGVHGKYTSAVFMHPSDFVQGFHLNHSTSILGILITYRVRHKSSLRR